MAVGIRAAALKLAWREIEQADEMIDHAAQLRVGDQTTEGGADLEVTHRTDMLERSQSDRREPDLRPRKRRHDEEGQQLAAENLVANRFVEQHSHGKAGGPAFALIKDALGLEKERLAESFGADDDEL